MKQKQGLCACRVLGAGCLYPRTAERDLTKGPFGGYLSVARSKALEADASIGRRNEFRGVPLMERGLHQKVERNLRRKAESEDG